MTDVNQQLENLQNAVKEMAKEIDRIKKKIDSLEYYSHPEYPEQGNALDIEMMR